jgi:hypothetical protein
MMSKPIVLMMVITYPLLSPALERTRADTDKPVDHAAKITELESRVDQLQQQLEAQQFERLTGRWRQVARHNEKRKGRFRIGSLLDLRPSSLSLDHAPVELKVNSDGQLRFAFDDGEVLCKVSTMGDYLKLELPDGIRYFFQKIRD